MRSFTLTPCRLSFVLCAFLALLTDPENGSHITVAEPPIVWPLATHLEELPI